jgi:hypothetical protein
LVRPVDDLEHLHGKEVESLTETRTERVILFLHCVDLVVKILNGVVVLLLAPGAAERVKGGLRGDIACNHAKDLLLSDNFKVRGCVFPQQTVQELYEVLRVRFILELLSNDLDAFEELGSDATRSASTTAWNSVEVVGQLGFVSTQRSLPHVEGVVEDIQVTCGKSLVEHHEASRSTETLNLAKLDKLLQRR